jgi:hypothetical protein
LKTSVALSPKDLLVFPVETLVAISSTNTSCN